MANLHWIEERLARAEGRTKYLEKWVDTGIKPAKRTVKASHSTRKKKIVAQ